MLAESRKLAKYLRLHMGSTTLIDDGKVLNHSISARAVRFLPRLGRIGRFRAGHRAVALNGQPKHSVCTD